MKTKLEEISSENAELRQLRNDPAALLPGDKVFIPDKREKNDICDTEQRHRFRRKGVPSMLCMRLFIDDEPRANESYILEIDGELSSGTLDADGQLKYAIPPNAKKGRLIVGESQDVYVLNLGHIDPIDEISGVQGRLNNMGFNCGAVDDTLNENTRVALKRFQKKHGLEQTGEPDEMTRMKLKELHGC